MEEKEKSPLDIITGYYINEGLSKVLQQDKEYEAIQKKIEEQTDLLDRQDFTKEQRLMIDRLMCAYTENGALYGRMTYKKGFKDCGLLLWEMGLLKAA